MLAETMPVELALTLVEPRAVRGLRPFPPSDLYPEPFSPHSRERVSLQPSIASFVKISLER
jgi:hypothetical protein